MITENEHEHEIIEKLIKNGIVTIQQKNQRHQQSSDSLDIKRSKRISSLYENTKYYLYDSNQNLQSNSIIMNRIYNNSEEACNNYNEDDYHKITNIMLAILDIYQNKNHASMNIQHLYNNCVLWVQNYNLVHDKSIESYCDNYQKSQEPLRIIIFPKSFCKDVEPITLPAQWMMKVSVSKNKLNKLN